MKELIEKIAPLVDTEYELYQDEEYSDPYEDYGPDTVKDSFDSMYITNYCEPEDATWSRDLSNNFYAGLSIGIRNTLKVLKDNPSLINELSDEIKLCGCPKNVI